jgi:uncharacterized lipoprotein YehR (DUF1307 family)
MIMKKFQLFIAMALFISITSCGQTRSNNQTEIKTTNKMDLSKISNESVRKAIAALQENDKKTWYSYFTEDAVFSDDGRKMDFKSFFDNAFEKKEKFLSLDKIENEGKDLYGDFYAGQWGTFKVFFKFHQNSEGKFDRIDIGQAK